MRGVTTHRPPESAAPKKTVLPGVALGFTIAGLCVVCLWPVGLVLAILAMVKTGKPEHAGRRGLAIAALCVAGLGLFTIGIQAAIAIPNFIQFQARSKQAECKMNLRSIFTAARVSMVDEQPLGSFEAMGFEPGPRNRYAYVLRMPEDVFPVAGDFPAIDPAEIQAALARAGVKPGVEGTCPDCVVTAACVGNVDNDDTLDVWSVSTVNRTAANGEAIPLGAPYNHVNDVRQ
ncbi:pilin [Corallococcus exiguus]|uniref:pilin n=1 Tax=Corallococcus TaxID=83461 RepID=UPI000EBD4B3F|nr:MULTISPECIES: pilin [Corallococcus]NNB94333.1 pilin [Corallococcus exiguus]NNC02209.1 pilin [Corallococcus exiguus]NPC46680.1 pilin [Corallococcus exiguus]RKH81866.1 pilin [Corallococcus sp. AB032C]